MFLELLEKIKQTKETSEQVKTFYHVTDVDNVESIKKKGLRAGSYITDMLEDAEAMRDIWMGEEQETQASIITFNLTSEQVNKLTVDQAQPNAYETHEVIFV